MRLKVGVGSEVDVSIKWDGDAEPEGYIKKKPVENACELC